MIRILIIEDNEERIDLFKQWMPLDIAAIYVRSAGRAVRVIELDQGSIYSGICLDHDLDEQTIVNLEKELSGMEVARYIARNISRNAPILVHSMNFGGGTSMTRALEAQGFTVSRIPFDRMTEKKLLDWIADVRAEWEYEQ